MSLTDDKTEVCHTATNLLRVVADSKEKLKNIPNDLHVSVKEEVAT